MTDSTREPTARRKLPRKPGSGSCSTSRSWWDWVRCRLRTAKCRLWDSGACVLEIGYDVDIAGMTCRELRHAIDRFHELAPEEWRGTAARCAEQFAANRGGGRRTVEPPSTSSRWSGTAGRSGWA